MIDSKVFGRIAEGELLKRMKLSPQWSGSSFQEMHMEPNFEIMASISGEYLRSKKSDRAPHIDIPVIKHSRKDLIQISDAFRIMWLGHAGIMIEYKKTRLLIDPMFSSRPSPIQWGGPAKRFHDAPFNLSDLHNVNATLISHNHYDHLDQNSIIKIKDSSASFIVPI